jgi:hypothetical protein
MAPGKEMAYLPGVGTYVELRLGERQGAAPPSGTKSNHDDANHEGKSAGQVNAFRSAALRRLHPKAIRSAPRLFPLPGLLSKS